MARKRRDGSAPRVDKAERERERERTRGKKRKQGREGRAEAEIYSFFHSVLSEMMSAPNEFPSRVLLP